MASSPDELPSCSKMNTVISAEGTTVGDVIINKFPVVVLTKLDPDILSVKVSAEDMIAFETQKQKGNFTSLSRKAEKNSEVKQRSWDDDITTLSDVSVSFSDDEEIESVASRNLGDNRRSYGTSGKEISDKKSESNKEKKRNTSTERRETSAVKVALVERQKKNGIGSTSQKSDVHGKEMGVSKGTGNRDGHKTSKRSTELTEIETLNAKKSKTEVTVEKVLFPEQAAKTKEDRMYNRNARYKLTLGPFNVSAVESESFRKFVNLAADCVVSFSKKQTGVGSMHGNAELFFGDFLTIESAMQRLSQLSVLTGKSWVKGTITCMEIKPQDKNKTKDQRKTNFTAKLFFQLCTEQREKLQHLISSKGRKKEDTKRKCVQLHRIPSSINEEMLSLLFPFSLGVKISHTDSSEKDVKGPVEIEFENQEWMEAVLVCFKNFGVTTSSMHNKLFNLEIKNFTPPKEKPLDNSSLSNRSDKQKQVTGGFNKGIQNQRDRNTNQGRDLSKSRNLGSVSERKYTPLNQHNTTDKRGLIQQNRNDQRKRTFAGANFVQRGLDGRDIEVKRSRLDNAAQIRGLARVDRIRNDAQAQHVAQTDVNQDALRQLAHARGLDPSNPDVIKILEMTVHLEKLQGLAIQQTAEANSLGLVGLAGQQAAQEHQLQLQQQALALKQAQEEAEARRYQAAVQAQQMRARELEEADRARSENLWQNIEAARRQEEEVRIQQEEYLNEIKRRENIAGRLKQLEEFDLFSRQGIQFQRGADTDSRRVLQYLTNSMGDAGNEFAATSKILPFAHAPATGGLLGAAPAQFKSDESMYTMHDESGLGQRERRLFEKNIPGKAFRQHNISDDQSISRSTSRVDRLKPKFAQKSPQSNQTSRDRSKDIINNDGIRKTRDMSGKFAGRQSRWNSDGGAQGGLNSFNQAQVDPDRNDNPLDFNRPQSRLTTEQAFKQDIERTRAALATGRSKPLVQAIHPLLEEARDRHGLPVQFGKNAVKKVPKEIEERRRAGAINERNARNFGPVNAFKNLNVVQGHNSKERWETGIQHRGGTNAEELQDQYRGPTNVGNRRDISSGGRSFNQETEVGTHFRGGLAMEGAHRDVAEVRTARGFARGGVNLKNDRNSMFHKGQSSALLLNKNQVPEHLDALGLDIQWRRNIQDQSAREQDSLRGLGGHVGQDIRERQAFIERQNEEPQRHFYSEGNVDSGRNEWKKPGGQFVERGGGYGEQSHIAGLQSKPSQAFEEEDQFGGGYFSPPTKRPYEARNTQNFTRTEKAQVASYEHDDYSRETGFGASDGYQARASLGGHGSHTAGSRGGGQGRGGFSHGRNVPNQGLGLLELPEHFKQQEDAYYAGGSDNSHLGAADKLGHFQQLQSLGRNNRGHPHMPPPPLPPLLSQRPGNERGVNFY